MRYAEVNGHDETIPLKYVVTKQDLRRICYTERDAVAPARGGRKMPPAPG